MESKQLFLLMNKTLRYALIMLVFSLCFTTWIYGQKVKSQAKVSVNIVSALIAAESDQLDFGDFLLNGSRCEVKITPMGKRVLQDAIGTSDQIYNAGKYYLTVGNSELYEIVLPYKPTILSTHDKSKSMSVFDWQINVSELSINNTNLTEISIGATLFADNLDNNTTGRYIGAYAITFMYN